MEQLYSLQSAAELLDTSVRTLRRQIKNSNDIQIKRVGSQIRLSESDLEKIVEIEETTTEETTVEPENELDYYVEQLL